MNSGTDVGGIAPEIYRNDLLRAEIYPDSDDTTALGDGADEVYDRVEFKYNRQGQATWKKDQNGTIHEFIHDALGRKGVRTEWHCRHFSACRRRVALASGRRLFYLATLSLN